MDILNDECCLYYELNLGYYTRDGNFNCILLTCCGKLFCRPCKDKHDKSLKESRKVWTCPLCRATLPENDEGDFERALPKAKEGKSLAEEWIGGCYYNGDGETKNYKKAFEFNSQQQLRESPLL